MYTATRDSGKAPNLVGLMMLARDPFSINSNVQVCPCLERTQILHNVLVIEILEQLYFAHYALKVFLRNAAQGHLFDRNSISSSGVESLVDLTIRAPA